jgi:hypothetical protein
MQYATTLWLFHHWNEVDKSRFDSEKRIELENRIKELEKQGVVRDVNYTQPIPPQPKVEEESSNIIWMIILGVIFLALIGGLMYYYLQGPKKL